MKDRLPQKGQRAVRGGHESTLVLEAIFSIHAGGKLMQPTSRARWGGIR